MRLRIAHSTLHRYDPPASGAIQVLRLTPRNHEGQSVIRWRIDVSADARLNAHEDAFGNLTHVFSADGPFDTLSVDVDGEVETENTDGVVRGAIERFPPSLFLRDTPLTRADAAIREFAQNARSVSGGKGLDELHTLLERLHGEIAWNNQPPAEPPNAAEAYARKSGSSRGLAHIFIGAARSLDIPARYVGGYLRINDGLRQDGAHAWAEAFVSDLGWVGFDPAAGMCPDDGYVRVAIGLDALGAAPVRGGRYGLGGQSLSDTVTVDQ